MNNSIYRTILINFLILLFFLIILEILTRALIYFYIGNSNAGVQERTTNLIYQPYLMFGPEWRTKISEFNTNKKNQYTVLILGASTAQNIPLDIFKSKIEKKLNKKINIFNGAYGGYNSIQQYIFLNMYGLDITPNLIISIDGANDIIFSLRSSSIDSFYLDSTYNQYLSKPLIAPFIWIIQNSQFINSLNRFGKRFNNYDYKNYLAYIDDYIKYKKLTNQILQSYNINHISVLQPHVAFKNKLNENELIFTRYDYRKEVVKELYKYLNTSMLKIPLSKKYNYLDSRKIFDNNDAWIFSDDVHFINNDGYKILIDQIVKNIKN